MPLCIDEERRELQEGDERVPVVRECVREREARGRCRREGDERRGDVEDLGRCKVLVEPAAGRVAEGWKCTSAAVAERERFFDLPLRARLSFKGRARSSFVLMSRNAQLATGILWMLSAMF